jgi:beta-lactamase class A
MARAPSQIRSDHPGSRQLAGDTTSGTATEPLTTRVTDSTDPDPLRTLRPRQTIYYQTLTDVLSRYYNPPITAAQGLLRRGFTRVRVISNPPGRRMRIRSLVRAGTRVAPQLGQNFVRALQRPMHAGGCLGEPSPHPILVGVSFKAVRSCSSRPTTGE